MLKRLQLPRFNPSPAAPCFCRRGKSFGECCGSRSPERSPPAGVQIFPGFLDTPTCKKWVTKLEEKKRHKAPVHVLKNAGNASVSREESKQRVCSNVKPGVLRKVINERIAEAFNMASSGSGHSVAWFESPSILRYRPGGYFLRHADSCLIDPASNNWLKVHDRDLSLLIYLNEEFTGGGLTFINFNYHFRPKAGDMLVFPSDNRYEHQAEVVNSGFRYCIASWAALKATQKVGTNPPPGAIIL